MASELVVSRLSSKLGVKHVLRTGDRVPSRSVSGESRASDRCIGDRILGEFKTGKPLVSLMTEVESEADEAAESDEEVAPDEEAAPETAADSSEAARGEIWIEKYRPQRLDEVAGHEDITERLSRYVERDDLPNLLFSGPAGVGKTTSAVAIAKELYGDDWESNFLELNASDQRGIDVVRDRIKNFARSSFGGYNYRIIFLDEADSLTSDAQSALRRTMEQFSNNTRFILSCNYSSKIIDPIQSRCATFRFGPISDEGVTEQILQVAEQEGIETTEDGIEALVYAADGDMRKAINALQAAAVMGEVVDEEAVFTITSTARPEEIEEMVTYAIEGDFSKARSILDDLLTNKGMAGGDIIDQLHRSVWEFELSDEATVRLMDRVGEVDYRITEGANERVQLEALLASLSLEDQ